MTPIEQNIDTATRAAQTIEKQLTETPNIPAKQLIVLTKQLNEHIDATNTLMQIAAAVDVNIKNKIVVPPGKIVTM